MREPLAAAEENDLATGATMDGELTSLVRRWMAEGTTVQDRARRETILRVVPEPERAEPQRGGPERVGPEPVGASPATPVEVDRVLALVPLAPLPPLPRRTPGKHADPGAIDDARDVTEGRHRA